MTPKEVAEYLHIHQNTLYKLIHLSEIPSFKIGSDHRFRRSEIEEWIAEKELPRERSRWYRKSSMVPSLNADESAPAADRAELAIRCASNRVGESTDVQRLGPNLDRSPTRVHNQRPY
jgi:excisionase family DNA binding protein